MDANDADSGPPDPAFRHQYKNPPHPGNLHDLPLGADSSGAANAASSPPSGGQQHGATVPPRMLLTLKVPTSKAPTKAFLMTPPGPLLPRLEEAETIAILNTKQVKIVSWPVQKSGCL